MARFNRLSAADRRSALIEASLECMAEGGITAFTVDKVSARANVSRGLITHHFGGMSGLLAAIYAHLYAEVLPARSDLPPGTSRLDALIDVLFDPRFFNRPALNTWLTMWGVIANTPDLAEPHRLQYGSYIASVAEIIAESVAVPDPVLTARLLICFVDGLSLQHCIDPPSMPAELARQACLDFMARQALTTPEPRTAPAA